MNIKIECGKSYRTLEFVGDLPKPFHGTHRHSRSLTFAGAWNAAVDLLIANRFILDIGLITIQFSSTEPKVHLEQFLRAGGFDEALESPEEAKSDFWLRLFETSDEGERYAEQMLRVLSSTMSPRLAMKMDIRRGLPPTGVKDDHEGKTPTQFVVEHRLPTIELTLCVTFGDVQLASQFFQSLSRNVPIGVNIHLVACCFRVTPQQIEDIVYEHRSLFHNVTILPESWGHEQGEKGNIGPWYLDDSQRYGVSWGRSVLHRAAALYSPTEFMWILDDDVLFEQASFFTALQQFNAMKSKGSKVGIGAILGDAPLPPPYMVRTQTVDFFYAGFLKSGEIVASPPSDMVFHDMHHDLSTESAFHLEFPLGIGNALNYSEFNGGVLQGRSLTRMIHSEWKSHKHILARGGNTLVIGKEVLLQYPNMAPNLGGIMCRRGDTLWVKRIQAVHPEWVQNADIALTQRRQEGFDFGTLDAVRGDIMGSMLVRYHDRLDGNASIILRSVFEREARLISNLKRTLALLDLMGVKSTERDQVTRLLNGLEQTPWPENLAKHLDSFINTYPLDTVEFQQAQGA